MGFIVANEPDLVRGCHPKKYNIFHSYNLYMICITMRKVNGIYVTMGVSFPRTGCAWLRSRLSRYFDWRFHYCEMYASPELMINVCLETNYQKCHDFGLSEPIRDDIKYVIQIRNFEDACISYYRLDKLHFGTNEKTPIQDQKPYVDTESDDYINFKIQTKRYYDKFVDKWINGYIPNSIVIHYENMIIDPKKEISSVISHITDDPVDSDHLT